uniref:RRM domain-containing protein n=1 Tax=Cannabis sativa TaxID=3483 RepID=A0A803PH50_CANSA
MSEEQMDFEDEEYGGLQKLQHQGNSGAISALVDEEPMGEDDEYDDLYNDVNIGDGFMQLHQSEAPLPPGGVSNGGLQAQKTNFLLPRDETGVSREPNIPGVSTDRKYPSTSSQIPGQKEGLAVDNKSKVGFMLYPNGAASVSEKGKIMGSNGSLIQHGAGVDSSVIPVKVANEHVLSLNSGNTANQTNVDLSVKHPAVNENLIRPPMENGSTMLFVGELNWWTTDAELENVLSQYGRVKEIKFFDERASGKSKGYCQVEFHDSSAATACKEGMHGQVFNGRACVVAFATSQTLQQMGAAYTSKNQVQNQSQLPQGQGRRPVSDGVGRGGNQNHQSGDGGRNFGRGGWGRGGQGILNRGGGGVMRGRGGGAMGAKNMVGLGSNAGGVGGYGQGLGGHAFGGPVGGMMNPQAMMGSGFDQSYMSRGGGYGGFPGHAYPGMLSSFPGVNTMGLGAVAPHVNPAFFGRGMTNNGMSMMGSPFMDGHHAGMWNETSMGGWGGDEQVRRSKEASYGGGGGGDDGASEYGYGEANHEKGVRSSVASRERERGSDRERRHHEERDQDWDRPEKEQREHGYREEKDGYNRDHRRREHDLDNDDDWDKGRSSSRPRSRSRVMPEDHQRSRSRDVDYGKRRRLPSE